jgi:hypothetical protein
MTHTPVPWTVNIRKDDYISSITDADGYSIIRLSDQYRGYPECGEDLVMDMESEDAAFIVRACNSHDELVEACKLGLRYASEASSAALGESNAILDDIGIIRAVLAKAEGGQA